MNLKKISIVVILTAVCSFSQINLLSNTINFRNAASYVNTTSHYGDLQLLSNNGDMNWGWIYCNKVQCGGALSLTGSAMIGDDLTVFGTKNFVQPHPTDTTKIIKYIAIESGEALTVARGTAKTINGVAEIPLPEHFSLVTSSDAPLTVLITPKKTPVLLFTQEESKEKLVVAMKQSDLAEFGDAEFAFQITGVRDGFENEEVIVDVDKFFKTQASSETKELSSKRKTIQGKVEKLMVQRDAITKTKKLEYK